MPTFRQDEKLGTKVPLIKTADFNDKSVTTEKLAEGSVTNSKLAPESVTQDKFDKELLQIFKAAAGLPENLIETIQNVDTTLADHQRQISSNDDDISDLQTKTKQIKDTVDGIAVSGGASVGSAVTYDNTQSGLDAQNIQNAIDELVNNLGHYETNEEWLRVYTDAENKFLWGIRVDGSIDWAVGIPKPIQKALNEIIANNETFQQTLTEAMEAYKADIDEKVAAIDEKKVDKEEGKSLIEDEVKECFKVIENEEFIKAVVDSEDRVLYGIYRDTGKPYYPQNDMYHISQSEEFLWVILDAANHPLLGIKQDGTCWAAKAQWLDDIKAIKNTLQDYGYLKDYFQINLKESSISILGDSLSTFEGYIPSKNISYYPNDTNDVFSVNDTWWMRLISKTNARLEINNSWSGSKVSGNDISSYLNRVDNVGNPKYLIIHGGTNDSWNDVPVGSLHFSADISALNINEFADSYDLLVRRAISLCPNTNIILVIPHTVSDSYAAIINEIAKYYNLFGCVDLRQYNFNTVNGHYQVEGMKTVEESIAKLLYTNKNVLAENGKSLINKDVAESFFYISNDEYIIAVVDAENRTLAGIKYDGEPYFPNHEMYSVITNEEWLYAIIDAEDKVLGGFRADDGHMIVGGIDISTFIVNAIVDIADIKERTAHLSTIENDEYLSVEIDTAGKVLGYTAPDGSHYLYKVKSETIPTEFSHIEDPEGRTEITTDTEDKILGYRDSEGTRHEHKISAKHLELSNEAAKEVNEAFKSAGIKMENPFDFSKDNHIELPIPRVAAQVNLYAQRLPMSKTDDISAKLEYVDKDGNYFVKDVVLNSQGSSSMGYIDPITGERGNLSVDFVDGTLITFGDWVSQDSFHFKKYYIDVFRGQCIVGYRLTEQVYKSHPIGEQYPYEKYISNSNDFSGLGVIDKDFNTGAKCHPEGFPIHINFIKTSTGKNTDLGIYTWNLKKSKEVYYMNKKKATNILLDGVFNGRTLWEGKIDWGQFEIRNPKSLIDINGDKYDGDNPKELSDTDANSKKVKDSLVRLSNALSDIKSNLNKETFEKYFLVNPFVDYILISQVIYNKDGFDKNWIWASWDGQLFTPTLYDLDSIFGSESSGIEVDKNSIETILGMEQYLPSYYLQTLYATEIKNRYKELRNNGIFSVDNIMNLLDGWLRTITYKYLNEDIKKYNETPSYRDSCISDKWNYISYNWTSDTDYDATKTYNADEQCRYYGCLFSAKESVTGVAPLTKLYDTKPRVLGYYNSPIRVKNWLKKRFTYLDVYYNFK